ncbi:MAG: nucleotidyltransferase domain-containing protein [Nitrospirae bacterium]|nr:nucleotidyltransferase domain-containing protein [Nitrospirota bacterium]
MDIINILFRSKIRQKILERFFADESRKFYINEMARFVGTTQGTCRRELNRLVDMGMLSTSREGNLQYYQVNRQNPFYKEFSTIIRKTIGIESLLRSALKEVEGVTYAFIFGSYAKKKFKPESDIDIAIIGTIDEDRLIKTVKNAEKAIGREINYHIYAEDDFKKKFKANSFLKNILQDYIMVSGDEREFRKLLKRT